MYTNISVTTYVLNIKESPSVIIIHIKYSENGTKHGMHGSPALEPLFLTKVVPQFTRRHTAE